MLCCVLEQRLSERFPRCQRKAEVLEENSFVSSRAMRLRQKIADNLFPRDERFGNQRQLRHCSASDLLVQGFLFALDLFFFRFIAVPISEEIDDKGTGSKASRMHRSFGNVIAITLAKHLLCAADSKFHLAINHNAPLSSVRMGRHLTDWCNVHEHKLMIFGL